MSVWGCQRSHTTQRTGQWPPEEKLNVTDNITITAKLDCKPPIVINRSRDLHLSPSFESIRPLMLTFTMKNTPRMEPILVSVLKWRNATQDVIGYPLQKFRLYASTKVNRDFNGQTVGPYAIQRAPCTTISEPHNTML